MLFQDVFGQAAARLRVDKPIQGRSVTDHFAPCAVSCGATLIGESVMRASAGRSPQLEHRMRAIACSNSSWRPRCTESIRSGTMEVLVQRAGSQRSSSQ